MAQQKLLTLDDIYGPTNRVNFSGAPAPTIEWIDGTHYAWGRPAADDRGAVDWLNVSADTGVTAPLFDTARAEAALGALPGIGSEQARRLVRSRDLIFNRTYSAAVFTIDDDLYGVSFPDGRALRLTSAAGEEQEPAFSPDGSQVAFVRNHNLFVVDTRTARETALTSDGGAKVLNGEMDWVYEEEIYGRGTKRAFWWSPDSSKVAFLRIDDTPVSTFVTLDDINYEPNVETWEYPRAGEANPMVRLGVAHVAGSTDWIDLSKYGPEYLVVRVGWAPAGALTFEVENRTQSWIDLNEANVSASPIAVRTILHETSSYWINSEDTTLPIWLKDGSFLWLSGRSGFSHAYHYSVQGDLIKQVTTGRWEVRSLHGVDDMNSYLYFSGTERSPIGNDIYRVKLDGSSLQRLSKAPGTHDADFSQTLAYYVDTWSDISTPPQTRLHRDDGAEVRVLRENRVAALTEFRLSTPEFLQVKTRDGFLMEAMMIKPPNFDPRRKYPVYQFTYGGPHSQQVRNAWTLQTMYHQLLAQHDVIVWICDNRTASGKGVESTWPVFKHFGELELRDIEDGISWLKQQPYVDGGRIGIH